MQLPSELLEQGWTQGALSRDSEGNDTRSPVSDSSVAWCIKGACDNYFQKAGTGEFFDWIVATYQMMNVIAKQVHVKNGEELMRWQDSLPHTKESQDIVVNAVRKAEVEMRLGNATT